MDFRIHNAQPYDLMALISTGHYSVECSKDTALQHNPFDFDNFVTKLATTVVVSYYRLETHRRCIIPRFNAVIDSCKPNI